LDDLGIESLDQLPTTGETDQLSTFMQMSIAGETDIETSPDHNRLPNKGEMASHPSSEHSVVNLPADDERVDMAAHDPATP
jgi:hypothetical protein